MMVFLWLLTLLYVFLMLFLLYGFRQVEESFGKNLAAKSTFSIVIPFRNEAENLPQLFSSLALLKYPSEMFEILLVNDASEDTSEELCREFQKNNPQLEIQLLQNKNPGGSPKKAAIETAVRAATHDFILTTDADCKVPEKWLQEFSTCIDQTAADVVAGPVRISRTEVSKRAFLDNLLESFQELDFFSLQAATVGGFGVNIPFMCNGANFCYKKAAFWKVDGFEGNSDIASGDDIFLLSKFKNAGFKTSFLKSGGAVVTTPPQPNLPALLSQRIRWAAKTSSYKSFFGKTVGLLVLLMNLSLLVCLVASLVGKFDLNMLFLIFLAKFNVDFVLLYNSARFFGRESILKNYFWCSAVYPFFSSFVALVSVFSGYTWKGRRFKK